ncbi:uncharacterized protein LOC122563774 isoform X5 [Chiloscyllium plagiosum]|uniref:uncharacterized protein LOC122563774 isoform X5 n=1 Tax=Chiloscyllium plagiosum TaxID=36176 RepID=UPI001CB7FFD2|nr:uncharacterized protein LOC122563774 isoform X5 [Chiloscyllium plagiosum]
MRGRAGVNHVMVVVNAAVIAVRKAGGVCGSCWTRVGESWTTAHQPKVRGERTKGNLRVNLFTQRVVHIRNELPAEVIEDIASGLAGGDLINCNSNSERIIQFIRTWICTLCVDLQLSY